MHLSTNSNGNNCTTDVAGVTVGGALTVACVLLSPVDVDACVVAIIRREKKPKYNDTEIDTEDSQTNRRKRVFFY